ncbi:MAG: 30S ribosomal protein S9 [Candidatus Levybacteria bacterium RIFCSPHIGHO2_02_FULL_37_13]|nr:MAG: 30S ribosomal protein S9 [Candidatus Levybacteria bacterium RIFCSPHIGHO2_02_FULL_37_13]OGH39996.1 MAG: 30S ribosomal protein S9 [Candidatus Levybacteria bacterium RIFCSPLOWO2_01_FULL_37_26]
MTKDIKLEKNLTKKEVVKKDYIYTIGRRKESVVRVRLYNNNTSWDGVSVNKGDIIVNKKKADEYFGIDAARVYKEPLVITGTENKFAITVRTQGGGMSGQLSAMVLGIARAINDFDKEKYRKALKKKGFLSRDARVRQRRKVGMGGKSRRKKQSPKR